MAGNSARFSPVAIAQGRFVLLGPSGPGFQAVCDSVRSLHVPGFVAFDHLVDEEVARGSDLGSTLARARRTGVEPPPSAAVSVLRHWFWSRDPRHGFFLAGFPGTVAQAVVFDAWLDERDIALSGAIALAGDSPSTTFSSGVATHYRRQGLLVAFEPAPSPDDSGAALCARVAALVADR